MRNKKILGLALGLVVLPAVSFAQTADTSKPDIQTYNSATSTTTIITAPAGYQSSVVSTYDGNQFHTVATSTPITPADIQKMQDDMRAEQAAMNRMFQDQQALFDEQNRMFEGLMNGVFPEVAPAPVASKRATSSIVKKNIPTITPPHIIATSTSTVTPSLPTPLPIIEKKPSFFQKFLHFFGL